jgi:acetoin utilization deacetylase AcuC-like enzyme
MINFYYSDEYFNHDTGSHPESIERIKVVKELLFKEYASHNFIEPSLATKKLISNVHDINYIDNIFENIPTSGFNYFDPDTIASPSSLKSYLSAVGGSVDAVDHSRDSQKDKNVYFCAHRPPGHHAEKNKAMGFGVFNNIAVSAQYANTKKNYSKILIVDFDVHHGNGTQHIFENNPNVFYASSHQFPFYPGTGDISETGNGNIFNCPLPSGCDSILFRKLFTENILEKINHNFDLLYFSAGFDAHKLDPLASINLEDDDFKWITEVIIEKYASNIPIISVLEGGYDMKGLYNSLNHHLKVLQKYSNE